jgi:hypothetical protein
MVVGLIATSLYSNISMKIVYTNLTKGMAKGLGLTERKGKIL